MNFNIINNLLFLFLFIPFLSCKNFEKEKNIYIDEENKDKIEIVDQIIIDSDLNDNQLYEDFYSNAFSVDFLTVLQILPQYCLQTLVILPIHLVQDCRYRLRL